ncbi:MAG: hypothetical protein FWC43_07810 [Planctomycetaceae bacterium]|nr:hypothetical protein [Planctomycetaceae bacterium]
MPKKGVKRKIGLDEAKRRKIIAVLTVGASRESAAKYVGCSTTTIRNEIQRDADFAEEVRVAEESSEVYFLQKIRAAADKAQYWRAAAWALERRCPNRYAPRGAKTLSEEQVKNLISDLVEIVIPEIHDPKERRNIIRKVNGLVHALNLPEEEIVPTTGETEE